MEIDFRVDMKMYPAVWTTTVWNWNKSSTHIEHCTRAVGWPRAQFGVLNSGPLSWKYTFISVGPSPHSPLLISLENLFTLGRKVAETYRGDMWGSTFKDLRWRNAVSPENHRSSIWTENSKIRYYFRVGARTFRHSVTDHSLQSSSDARY